MLLNRKILTEKKVSEDNIRRIFLRASALLKNGKYFERMTTNSQGFTIAASHFYRDDLVQVLETLKERQKEKWAKKTEELILVLKGI